MHSVLYKFLDFVVALHIAASLEVAADLHVVAGLHPATYDLFGHVHNSL